MMSILAVGLAVLAAVMVISGVVALRINRRREQRLELINQQIVEIVQGEYDGD